MGKKGRVALVSGGWGQNIGNAFFNIGGKRILEEVFAKHRVEFIQDQPGYWLQDCKEILSTCVAQRVDLTYNEK